MNMAQPTQDGRAPSVSTLPAYVLITPARNEAAFIELTLKSVIAQTVLPLKWIIVSDGSTDGTDEIVKRYAAENGWIQFLRMPERSERHFGGKVAAFNAGFDMLKGLDYGVIGSLDADISFEPDYFAFLLVKLRDDSKLGLVGTPFREGPQNYYDYRFMSLEHVSGACQLFRRECFENIGGYVPLKGGGVDHMAVLCARMKGWRTRTFTDKSCFHHRKMGSAKHRWPRIKFHTGALDYALGAHPLWEVFRAVYQMSQPPFIAGGLLIFAGYFWSMLCRAPRPIPIELMKFRRNEQIKRLRKYFTPARATLSGE